jgi:tetratricopeptide (TPR) repeat protein
VGLMLVSLLILLPTANLYWRLARPLPIPVTTLPNPNGYDDLVKAGKTLGAAGVPILETATHAQFKAFVAQNGRGYALVQTGLSRPCQRPPTLTWDDQKQRIDETQALRELARALCGKAKLAELDGRPDDAIAAYLDTIRLGNAAKQGGMGVVDWLTGDTFEGMGREGICRLRKSLSAAQCRQLVLLLKELMDRAPSLEGCLERDAVFNDHATGACGRLFQTVTEYSGEKRRMQGGYEKIRDRDLAKMRLLVCELALRAYALEHGQNPGKLVDLVPGYLSEVPKDPLGGGEFVYRRTPEGYELRSSEIDYRTGQYIALDKPHALALDQGNAAYEKGDFDTAIARFTEAIRLDPTSGWAYFVRGAAYASKGELDNAIADCTEAIRHDPTFTVAYNGRGMVYQGKREFDKAIADYTEAIRLDPWGGAVYGRRGDAYASKGEWDKAIADGMEAIHILSDDPEAQNRVAWWRATCPKAAIRNGPEAIKYATKACESTQWKAPGFLDTLAAAYAEAGQFDKAVEWQQKALAKPEAFSPEELKGYRQRLELYKAGKPYREK